MAIGLFPHAQLGVSRAEVSRQTWLARVLLFSLRQLSETFLPQPLPAVDVAAVFQGARIVRLQSNGPLKLSQGIVIFSMTEIVDNPQRNVCFGQRRGKVHRVLRGLPYFFEFRLGQICDKPMTLHSTV